MQLLTLAQMRSEVEKDLDLEDEDFIDSSELNSHINDGIDDAEALIHTLYEDYFLTTTFIPLVTGTRDYALPTDIFANKIRSINYNDGTNKYEIKRWRKPLSRLVFVDTNDDYQYLPINTTASGYQLRLLPTSRVTNSTVAEIWYLRGAKKLTLDADVCDIPEFARYVVQFAKVKAMRKEGHPDLMDAENELSRLRELMVTTLTNMTDDENTEIPMDLGFYEDFDSNLVW